MSMISNVLAGYRLATDHLRQLLAVLLPVVAAALLGLALLDLALGRDATVIINRLPVVHGDHVLAWARLAVVAGFWLLGLTAAALTAAGGARGHAVRPRSALLAAARSLPVLAAGAAAVYGLTVGALWIGTGDRPDLDRIVAALATADGPRGVLDAIGPANRLRLAGALLVAGLIASRLVLGLLPRRLGGRPNRGLARSFLLGGIAVPLVPVLWSPFLLPLVVLLQAGLLAHLYLLPDPSVDPTIADARLGLLSGRPARLPWLAGAATATAAALLVPAGVAAANPLHAPTVRAHADAPGEAVAAIWPAGGHPVIATGSGARFCDDDVCDRYVAVNGGPAVMGGYGVAGISADGTSVVRAALTGGPDKGGPFIHYARCTRTGCHQAWLPVRASAREHFAWPSLAAAVAPDGALWFALATPSAGDKTFGVRFVRCPEVGCPHPERHDAGTVEHVAEQAPSPENDRVRLAFGPDGRPIATIRTGLQAFQLTCCDNAAATPAGLFTGEPGPVPVWTAGPGRLIAFQPGRLQFGEQLRSLPGGEIANGSGAVATNGSEVYATAAEAQSSHWQQVVWHCTAATCHRQVLDEFPTALDREAMAVATDGRVFIARPDRVLLLSERPTLAG